MTRLVREAGAGDADRIADWLNRPWVRKYLSSNLRGGAMEPGLVRAALRRPDQSWHVVERDGEACGLIVFDTIDRPDGIANIWYALADEGLGGSGLMSDALAELLGRNPLGLAVVTAWIGAPNRASARCLEKAGFRKVGEISSAFNVDGRHNRLIFEMVLDRR